VMTRMGGRYLAIVLPMMALLWWSSRTVRLARLLLGASTVLLAVSLLAQLGVTALQIPFSLGAFRSSSVLVLYDPLVTVASLVQVLVSSLAVLAVYRALRGRPLWAVRPYPPRLSVPPLPARPRVSVIILNYNGGSLTRRCVTSVLTDPYPNKEVIVVDNASTDGSLGALDDYVSKGRIAVVRNEANLHFARGNNRGAAAASGELLLFLNNDTEIEPDVIEHMVVRFRAEPSLGSAQPLVLFLPERHLLNSAGAVLDTLAFHEILGLAQPRSGYTPSEHTSYAVGAAVMIRRELFERAGGFDPLLGFYYTDADLSWKVWLAGYTVAVVPDAVVYHAEGSGLGAFVNVHRLRMMIKGQLTVVARNYELPRALFGTAALLFLYQGLAFMYLIRGSRDVAQAIVRSLAAFLLTLPEIARGRAEIASYRSLSDPGATGRFLVPFNPVRVFQRKREGWGYLADREATRLE